jgi:ribosomal-protein-alanine N-acetyltransferase
VDIEIKRLKKLGSSSEILKIARLEKEIFTDPWSENSLNSSNESLTTMFFVAKVEDSIVGYLIMYAMVPEGEIVRIGVSSDFRRQGIGKALFAEVKKYCKEKKIKRLLLDVRSKNATAIRFYKSLGFHKDGVRKYFYNNPEDDAILMSKHMWI